MKTWKRALALVLALVMALSLVALPSFAEGEEDSAGNDGMPYIEENGHGGTVTKDGLVMSKTIKKTGDSQFLLTLEAYATGSTTTTTTKDPVDIVLVLDVSGSMDDYMETYSISPDGIYYYYADSYSGYQRVYYCSQCRGWYTKEHSWWNHGTQLTPKTSASDTNTSHTQFYSDVTKITALKTAVNAFIDNVAKESPDSNIAIVKFAGDKKDTVGNDTYREDGYTYNYSQIVQNLTTVDETGASSLKTAVNGLIAAGTTLANYGMEHAQTIINRAKDNGHQKVVVMFTDGEPNGIKEVSGFEKEVANSAINTSKSIKDAGATVYTIGCFGSLDADKKANVDTYMDYVSSNYPNATSMTSGGAKADPANYYKTVSSAADLNNIFQDISHTIGGTTVTLGSTSVLRDVISDSFTLPEGYKDGDIKAYSVSCTGKNGDTYTWANTPDAGKYTVTVDPSDNKTINVTDFSYADNWVDQFGVKDSPSGGTSHGKKLVVEIPIVPEQDATGSVKTNGDASGIYADSTVKDPVEKFPSPVVYIPFFTVAHVASTVNDQGHNEGKRTGETHHPVWCNRPFNLTSVVTENYLYGGTFNEETCTTVHKDVQEQGNPMELNPTENATYYIWEVPNTYLTPRNYNVWRHLPENNGQKTVVRLYPLTAADRTLYKQVGFVIDGQNYVSGCDEFNATINNTPTLYQTAVAKQNGQHYQTLYLDKGTIRASNTAIDESGLVSGQHIDDGCLAGIKLDANGMIKFKTTGVTFRPYWITLDNVKVYGTTARTCTYLADSETAQVTKDTTTLPCEYMGDTVTTQAMSFAKSFTMDDSQPVVDESLTVTVVDGSNTTQVKVAPNGSVRDQVAYQAPAGKVFAGWFADQAYTTPADLDQITQDTTIYAKYVSDSYLDLAYSRIGLFRLRGVTLISAVDNPANYQASGIIVNGDKLNVSYASRYRIFKTPASLFGAARNAKLMLADKSLSGTGTLEVTPYWITLDGTEVHGITHSLHYNTRTIWE